MRVLVLDQHYREPPFDGGSRALWDLRRSLRDLGHDCTLSAQTGLLEDESWDVVMVSRPVLAAQVAQRAKQSARRHTVFLGHDLHHQRLAAPHGVLPSAPRPVAAMAALERHCWATYDVSLYPNQDEVELVCATGAHARWFPYFRIDEVPAETLHQEPDLGLNGLSRRSTQESEPLTLLFVGGSAHAPNITGLRWFAAEVLPVLQQHLGEALSAPVSASRAPAVVRVVVAGPWQAELRDGLAQAGLIFVGPVSDEGLPKLRQQADANIAPLTAGAGLPSKVIEALASGVPLIATSTAMAGIRGAWDVALPGDEPLQWLESIGRVRNCPEDIAAITARAAGYVHRHHSAENYLTAVCDVLNWVRD